MFREHIGNSIELADESLPYAKDPLNNYIITKIEGEKIVLEANDYNGLLTVAIRPGTKSP